MVFASIVTSIADETDTDEAGAMYLQVAASNDSTSQLRQALTATGHGTDDKVDIGLGYGATSTTTVAGDLIVSGGNITGPTDSSLNILSDDSMNFAIDKDNDQTSFFNWYANGVPHLSLIHI